MNRQFRNLVTLQIRITLLSDVFATAGYAHGRASISLLQILMSNMTPQIVANLGALHRAGVWENISLVVGLSAKGINVASSLLLPMDTSPDQSTVNLDDVDASISPSGTNGVQPTATTSTNTVNVPGQDKSPKDPRERNATALKHLTHGLPNSLAPFFQGIIVLSITSFSFLTLWIMTAMVKMFHARRNPDVAQKKQITESSAVVADIMLKHINFKPTSGRSH